MDERPAAETLRSAFRATITYSPDRSGLVRQNVRYAVCRLVEELRTEGMAPEEIIVAVRAIAKSVVIEYGSSIATDAVQWAIAHYFGARLGE